MEKRKEKNEKRREEKRREEKRREEKRREEKRREEKRREEKRRGGRINEVGSSFITQGGSDKDIAIALPEQLLSF